ncbi:MAG: DUF3127 domain-containing protein [Capnocytophaga sp.]|nr:DUF3127 domain-containing protein [Capnocytophaga sp.]
MDIQGHVKLVSNIQSFGENGFQKREIVITTDEQYPQSIIFEFTQGNCSLLDKIQTGDMVKIYFNIRGREWKNPQGEIKYFNSLQGWRIEILSSAPKANVTQTFTQQQPANQVPKNYPQPQLFDNWGQAPANPYGEEDNGVPF